MTETTSITVTTGDPDRDYELGWNYLHTVPEGASRDFVQGANDRGWATHSGGSTNIEDSPRWIQRRNEADRMARRQREVAYMAGGGHSAPKPTQKQREEHVADIIRDMWPHRMSGRAAWAIDRYYRRIFDIPEEV